MKLPIGSLELLLRAARKATSFFGPYSVFFEELSNRLVLMGRGEKDAGKLRGQF